jgi:integrase
VFPHDDGNVMPRDVIIDQLYAIERRLGIVRPNGAKYRNGELKYPNGKPKYNVHALRHFYASNMIAQGTEPTRLQELLGHSTLAMTMDTYGHLFPAGDAEKNAPTMPSRLSFKATPRACALRRIHA